LGVEFFTNNAYKSYPQLQRDVNGVKEQVAQVDSVEENLEKCFFGSITPVRRVMSLPDKFEKGDAVAGLGLASLAIVNLPEDIRDMKAGYHQLAAKLGGKAYTPAYDYSKYQHDFSFFKGTLMQEWMNKAKTQAGKERVAKWYAMDKTLYASKFGDKVKNFLGITNGKQELASGIKDVFGNEMIVTEVVAKNKFAELTGRAMKRVTVLGVVALALLELPKLFKAMNKGESISEQAGNTIKQTGKSAINVTSILAGIGYGGALGAKKFGAMGSLVGMGVGAVIGATASNKIQDIIA
jgi:hypothetical protein